MTYFKVPSAVFEPLSFTSPLGLGISALWQIPDLCVLKIDFNHFHFKCQQ